MSVQWQILGKMSENLCVVITAVSSPCHSPVPPCPRADTTLLSLPCPRFFSVLARVTSSLASLETFSKLPPPLWRVLLPAPWDLGPVPHNLTLDYITAHLTPFLWVSLFSPFTYNRFVATRIVSYTCFLSPGEPSRELTTETCSIGVY